MGLSRDQEKAMFAGSGKSGKGIRKKQVSENKIPVIKGTRFKIKSNGKQMTIEEAREYLWKNGKLSKDQAMRESPNKIKYWVSHFDKVQSFENKAKRFFEYYNEEAIKNELNHGEINGKESIFAEGDDEDENKKYRAYDLGSWTNIANSIFPDMNNSKGEDYEIKMEIIDDNIRNFAEKMGGYSFTEDNNVWIVKEV